MRGDSKKFAERRGVDLLFRRDGFDFSRVVGGHINLSLAPKPPAERREKRPVMRSLRRYGLEFPSPVNSGDSSRCARRSGCRDTSLVQHDSPYHGVVSLGSEKYNLSDIPGATPPALERILNRSLCRGDMPFAQGANAKGLYFNPDRPWAILISHGGQHASQSETHSVGGVDQTFRPPLSSAAQGCTRLSPRPTR
jgi:hypothetical protein